LVVGGGMGGIASALLSALDQNQVTLLEAHNVLGGCASYFRRGQFVFDAGATTVSGVRLNEPLGRLFELLGAAPALVPADPGITFHLSNGKVVKYHRDVELWMRELESHFPGLPHRPFWKLVQEVADAGWKLLKDIPSFPPSSLVDLLSLARFPHHLKLVSHLLTSTELTLKRFGLDTSDYLELVNGIMIISAQVRAGDAPFMVGALALSYPAETYAPRGGMKGLMDFFSNQLKEKKVNLLFREKVLGLEKRAEGFMIKTSKGADFLAEEVILNVPVWNQPQLLGEPFIKKAKEEAQSRPGSWGAFTVYFGCEEFSRDLYQQVHLKHPLVDSYFISLSVKGDKARAPEGYQSVTISTHVLAEEWFELSDDHYEQKKKQLGEIILQDFKRRFNIKQIKFFTAGSPKTFEDFTHRERGFVGGLPFLYGKNPFKLFNSKTHVSGLYRVGDTIFPGQGLVGVTAGAFGLQHELKKN
jgi:C-3',4' desaturase CrtD